MSNTDDDANRRHREASMDEEISRFQDRHHRFYPRFDELSRGRSIPPSSPIYSHRSGTDHGVPRPYNLSGSRRPSLRARGSTDRYRHTAHERSSSGPRDLHRAVSELDAASSNLRALLDDPIPTMSHPGLLSLTAGNDSANEAEPGRRSKRRKLDSDESKTGYKGFSYGYYGQVVPGQLRLEIVSCDGGSFESETPNKHAAENVLKDDHSVYCTKANRCNLILKHEGGIPFCLDELVIKAPATGYTAPVQEGMVFVSMTSDDLLGRTARYQIQYSSPKRPRRHSSAGVPSQFPNVISYRHNSDETVSPVYPLQSRRAPAVVEEESRHAQIPSEFEVLNSANFTVTTECSDDEEEDDDDFSSPYRNRDPRIEPFFDDGTDAEESHNTETPWYLRPDSYIRSPRPAQEESSRRETPSQFTLAEAVEASQIATQEAVKAVGGEYMAAHARFFIEKNKSKCTIKFDPPISGRFILLKMWSPRRENSKNIDIQSVVARGYAGPRLFPAQQFR